MGENYSFTVNGVMRSTSEDKPLLRYLREDLHLHSVKDGCSEGAAAHVRSWWTGRRLNPVS